MKLDGVEVGCGEGVAAALSAARRRGKCTATFFGGKPTGGGGMNLTALGKAVQAASKLAADKEHLTPEKVRQQR